MTTSAWPARRRALGIASTASATRMWLVTAPPFWAMPVMSSTLAARPSMCAAMAISAPTVRTPVPPMPVTSRARSPASTSG